MNPKRVTVSIKHNDLLVMLIDEDFEHVGYAPGLGMFEEGSDQTEFTIDNETGRIIGWRPISTEEIANFKKEIGDYDEQDG